MMSRPRSLCLQLLGVFLSAGIAHAQLWTASLQGTADGRDSAERIAMHPSGDVIAVGVVENDTDDALAARIASGDGSIVWRTEIDGAAMGDDGLTAVAVDSAGNVLVAGLLKGSGRVIMKLDGNTGAEIWRQDAPGAVSVVVDALDDVYAVGGSDIAPATQELRARKLAGLDGALLWETTITGAFAGNPTKVPLAVDGLGGVFVGASIWYGGDGYFGAVKLDAASGAEQWRYQLEQFAVGLTAALSLDGAGDVFVAGNAFPIGGTSFFVVAKIRGASGIEVWHRALSGGYPKFGYAFDVTVDSMGNAIAVGSTSYNFAGSNFTAIKFDAITGDELWRTALDGDAYYTAGDIAYAVAVDANDDAIVVGQLDGRFNGEPQPQFGVAKLAKSSGAVLWRQGLHSLPYAGAFGVGIDGAGNVFAGGTLTREGTFPDATVAKFDGATGGSYLLQGTRLLLRDVNGAPAKRRLKFSTELRSTPLAGGPGDPRMAGATLELVNPVSGETMTLPLPAAGWSATGKGYRYRSAGPCRKIDLSANKKASGVCVGAGIGFTLDEASQGTLALRLQLGTVLHCASFGGEITADSSTSSGRTGLFRAKKSLAPATCP